MDQEKKGKIHIYTGDGKGKTTAAVGLATRALGRGYKVAFIQFLKARESGEFGILKKDPNFIYQQFGRDDFVDRHSLQDKDFKLVKKAFKFAQEVLKENPNLIVLDEINAALDFGLLETKDVLDYLDNLPAGVEVVLTGRNAKLELVERADLVTEMREVKHYFRKGVGAREGIEY